MERGADVAVEEAPTSVRGDREQAVAADSREGRRLRVERSARNLGELEALEEDSSVRFGVAIRARLPLQEEAHGHQGAGGSLGAGRRRPGAVLRLLVEGASLRVEELVSFMRGELAHRDVGLLLLGGDEDLVGVGVLEDEVLLEGVERVGVAGRRTRQSRERLHRGVDVDGRQLGDGRKAVEATTLVEGLESEAGSLAEVNLLLSSCRCGPGPSGSRRRGRLGRKLDVRVGSIMVLSRRMKPKSFFC